jgi:hypothetical protein
VEGANTASAAVKLYNKWQKLLAPESESESGSDATNVVMEGGEGKEKKGLLHKVKNHIRGKNKTDKGGEMVSMCDEREGEREREREEGCW